MFAEQTPNTRNQKARTVRKLFYQENLRNIRPDITACVQRLVRKIQTLKTQAWKTSPVATINFLDLARRLALDGATSTLLGQCYGALEEETQGRDRMSASLFVDELAGYGRIFYISPLLFGVLAWIGSFFSTRKVEASVRKVDNFLWNHVKGKPGSETYHGCMLLGDVCQEEVVAECKDLLFAGTDSTGMNLSTWCWQMAKNPKL